MNINYKTRKHGRKAPERDASQRRRALLRLDKLSIRKRKAELKALREAAMAKPTKRDSSPPDPSSKKTTVMVNVRGDLRGMHLVDKPPSSEHMRKIRAMRKIYNKQMPPLQCNNCSFSNACPQFKAGYECAFLPYLNSHNVSDEGDLLEAMKNLCSANMRRAQHSALAETLKGSEPSVEVSESINMAFMQLSKLYELMLSKSSVTVTTSEDTIIGRLFGNLDNLVEQTEEAQKNPIQVIPRQITNKSEEIDPLMDINPAIAKDVNLDLVRAHSRSELKNDEDHPKQKGGIMVTEL